MYVIGVRGLGPGGDTGGWIRGETHIFRTTISLGLFPSPASPILSQPCPELIIHTTPNVCIPWISHLKNTSPGSGHRSIWDYGYRHGFSKQPPRVLTPYKANSQLYVLTKVSPDLYNGPYDEAIQPLSDHADWSYNMQPFPLLSFPLRNSESHKGSYLQAIPIIKTSF